MTVEVATYISDLNTANPGATDLKAEGDDHLRLIKTTVKATFPNVTGAVTPTHTVLNNLAAGTFPTVAVTGVTNLTTTGSTILGDAATDTLNIGANGIVKNASNQVLLGTTTVGIGASASTVLSMTNGTATNFASLKASGGEELLLGASAAKTYVGSFSSTPFSLRANNIDVVFVNTSSQVGIGATPSYKLNVIDSGNTAIVAATSVDASGVTAFMQANSSTDARFGNLSNLPVHIVANGTPRLTTTGDGRVYGSALHNNAGAVTGTTNQYIASGTYTPTLTNSTNIAASTANLCTWMRVGNVVTVAGIVGIDPTSPSTGTVLQISLPIASNFTSSLEAGGTAVRSNGAAAVAATVGAETASDTLSLAYLNDTDVANRNWTFTVTYLVL